MYFTCCTSTHSEPEVNAGNFHIRAPFWHDVTSVKREEKKERHLIKVSLESEKTSFRLRVRGERILLEKQVLERSEGGLSQVIANVVANDFMPDFIL